MASIKPHLRSYSIVQRRRTTVNHAFASALAPCDAYDEQVLRAAMAVLGQTDMDDLRCVYCRSPAETWDHLVGLVKDSELNGYGHQIGNLVPSCGRCNSLKGNKNWRDFVSSAIGDPIERDGIVRRLTEYLGTFAREIDLQKTQREHPAEWRRYNEIKQQIITLMAEADVLAATLRL